MPTVVEGGSRTGSGPLAVSVSMEDVDDARRSPVTLLIDTIELVEPRKRMHVPNHLLETKVYSKIGKNALIHVTPEVVNFDGFEVNQKHVKKLAILNASSDLLRMHLIPPQTKYFNIKYKKGERMVPGLTLECTIEFMPDEWRYYYDCIRINCPGEDNLVIPIHGYPIMSTKDFPQQFTFPVTPVGHRVSQGFPLRCMAPIDFEFELIYTQPHPAFTIHPMTGIVPANSETEVVVTFAPFEFQTASMVVQLNISQYNAKPILCKFTGSSKPGLLREKTLTQSLKEKSEVLDPRCVSPLDRSRHKRKVKPTMKEPQPPKTIEYKGLQFPAVIDSPSAVAQVLNQETGKLKAKDLRETMLKKDAQGPANRQAKEARFDHAVRQSVYEERQNQLRWQVKVGDEQMSNKQRSLILDARRQAYAHYKYNKREDPVPEDEYVRQKTSVKFRRTVRDAAMLADTDVTFDPYNNDTWATRHAALNRFIQAARKVIIRSRAAYKLNSLRKFILDWSRRKTLSTGEDDEQEVPITQQAEEEEEEERQKQQLAKLTARSVQRVRFPTYIPPNVKDDMAADALGSVPFEGTQVVVKQKVPFFNLKVPQVYRLQGYQPHGIHDASSGYVPPCLTRPLRMGAQDEVISLPQSAPSSAIGGESGAEGDVTVIDVPTEEDKDSPGEVVLPPAAVPTLAPPDALFRPIEYPPLHIMNPAPGLQIFQAPVPFAEVDSEFHLCPLPRYFRQDYANSPHTATQRKYLDREDTIRGLMNWKKFPSQGLTSLSNTPTLTNVWVPRWDNTFSKDLMPASVPHLFDGLPPDDAENLTEGSDWEEHLHSAQLTPDMVNAQFALIDAESSQEDVKTGGDVFPFGNKMPSTNIPVGPAGPVPREKREEELEYFMTKKYNRLGSKVSNKVTTLNAMLTQPQLQLH